MNSQSLTERVEAGQPTKGGHFSAPSQRIAAGLTADIDLPVCNRLLIQRRLVLRH
jgi:hypothetical protein